MLRVSPQAVVFSETSQGPNNLTEIYCPWGDRNQARQRGQHSAVTEFIYHLDEDVEPASLDQLHLALQEFDDPSVVAVSGPYQNPKGQKLPGRIYNFLSNLWLKAGERDRNLFLAGHVLCRKEAFEWPLDMTTGGEEDVVSRQIYHSGRRILYRADFAAVHYSDHTWVSLFERLRGHEKAKPSLSTSRLGKLNLLFRNNRT